MKKRKPEPEPLETWEVLYNASKPKPRKWPSDKYFVTPPRENTKTTIFLTGASGVMGHRAFLELINENCQYRIVVLLRPSEKNRQLFQEYMYSPHVHIVWGDLVNYEDVLECVSWADYVLHVGGMVPPFPENIPKGLVRNINVVAMKNIIQAVKAQEDPNRIKVVYVGSVAQMGDRRPPNHWGAAGDFINIARLDEYALSKCEAERLLSDSGLRYWVSLRQSGILHKGLINNALNKLTFHVPMESVLEWTTMEDSGRLMLAVCDKNVPESFWRRYYNVSSGTEYRLTNYEFMAKFLYFMHLPPPEKIFRMEWFATKNFHGMWYTDSDKLDDILRFRRYIPVDEYFEYLTESQPWYYLLGAFVPAFIMRWYLKPLAKKAFTPQERYISFDADPNYVPVKASRKPAPRQKRVDPTKETITLEDLRTYAGEYAGELLSPERFEEGDEYTILDWQCQRKHRFTASANTVVRGGHWCPKCLAKRLDPPTRFGCPVW